LICVADLRQFTNPLPAATETYLGQLALADVIITNKADLPPRRSLRPCSIRRAGCIRPICARCRAAIPSSRWNGSTSRPRHAA